MTLTSCAGKGRIRAWSGQLAFSFGVRARSSRVEDDTTGNRKENPSACVCTYVRDDGQTSSEGIRGTVEPIRSLRQPSVSGAAILS
jgi:hypothetical protein